MKDRFARIVLMLGTAAALGGCSLFDAPRISRAGSTAEQPAQQAHAAPWTQQGREHLAHQQNALSIEAFNRAIAFGEAPAPALNGLGVAYARLGRNDLAFRFFRKAAFADPQNALYTRNLVALTNSPGFSLAQMRAAETRPAASAGTAAPASAASNAAAPARPGKLRRDGNRQFSLVTVPASSGESAAPAVAVATKPRPVALADKPAATTPASGKRKVIQLPSATTPVRKAGAAGTARQGDGTS